MKKKYILIVTTIILLFAFSDCTKKPKLRMELNWWNKKDCRSNNFNGSCRYP